MASARIPDSKTEPTQKIYIAQIKVSTAIHEQLDQTIKAFVSDFPGNKKMALEILKKAEPKQVEFFNTNKSLYKNDDAKTNKALKTVLIRFKTNPQNMQTLQHHQLENIQFLKELKEEDLITCYPHTYATKTYSDLLSAKNVDDLSLMLKDTLSTLWCPSRPAAIAEPIEKLQERIDGLTRLTQFHSLMLDTFIDIKEILTMYFSTKHILKSQIKPLLDFVNYLESIETAIIYRLRTLKLDDSIGISAPFVLPAIPYLQPDLKLPATRLQAFLSHTADFLISEAADLNIYPQALDQKLCADETVYYGDLHGNFLKLIYHLIRENIVREINKEDYAVLVSIFYHSYQNMPSRSDIKRFILIIAKMTASNPGDSPTINLIGDVFSDRGPNDLFTLLIYQKLAMLKITIKTELSNHDFEFISAYENNEIQEPQTIKNRRRFSCAIDYEFVSSLHNLGDLLQEEIISTEEIIEIYETAYLPTLTLLNISYDEKKQEIYFASHAPVPISIVPRLLDQLDIQPDSKRAVYDDIALINQRISEILYKKEFHKYCVPGTPICDALCYRLEFSPTYDYRKDDTVPAGWKIVYIHGHDGKGVCLYLDNNKRTINLDNKLGISPNIMVGNFNFYYTGNNPNFLELRNAAIKKQLSVGAQSSTAMIHYTLPSTASAASAANIDSKDMKSNTSNKRKLLDPSSEPQKMVKKENTAAAAPPPAAGSTPQP